MVKICCSDLGQVSTFPGTPRMNEWPHQKGFWHRDKASGRGPYKTNLKRKIGRVDICNAMVSRVQQCIVTMVQDTVWTSGVISRWNGSICFLGNTIRTSSVVKEGCSFCPCNAITGKLCRIDEWRVLPPRAAQVWQRRSLSPGKSDAPTMETQPAP